MSTPEKSLNATWLNRLRWFAVFGQLVTVAAAAWLTPVELRLEALGLVLAIEVAFAAAADVAARRGMLASRRALFGCMVGDVLILTGLLYFAGGPENPFNFLYLVHVTLALVVAGERVAWSLLALCSVLFGMLFVWHTPLHVHGMDAHSTMNLHMQGMWVGFVVAGVSIVGFMSRLSRAVTQRDAELVQARERMQAAEQLAALGTLAAGAAHELNTPLSTIALASKELELSAREAGELGEAILADAVLIRSEIERCRTILEQLSLDAGHPSGSAAQAIAVGTLLGECGALDSPQVSVVVPDDVREHVVTLPLRPLVQALSAVLANAIATESEVRVTVSIKDAVLDIEVADDGPGMTPEVLAHAFDPFYTTRPTGRGMGLGLFLARRVAEAIGGTLSLESSPSSGTRATFRLPVSGGST